MESAGKDILQLKNRMYVCNIVASPKRSPGDHNSCILLQKKVSTMSGDASKQDEEKALNAVTQAKAGQEVYLCVMGVYQRKHGCSRVPTLLLSCSLSLFLTSRLTCTSCTR